jgi:hypothetical protein
MTGGNMTGGNMICPLKPRVTVAETVMMVMEATTMMETAGTEKITRKHLFYPLRQILSLFFV